MTSSTSRTDNIEHARFCLSRPGESERRIETYTANRTGPDGVLVVGQATVVRCIECGERTIDGVPAAL